MEVSDEYGERGGEEGFEEGGVEVDDGEDPVEGIDDDSEYLKDEIEVFPVPTDNDHAVLCEGIVYDLYHFDQTKLLNAVLDAPELVRNKVVFAGIDQF